MASHEPGPFYTVKKLVDSLKDIALRPQHPSAGSVASPDGKRQRIEPPTMNVSVASAGKLRIITFGHADVLWKTAFQLQQALANVEEVKFNVCIHIAGSSYTLGDKPEYMSRHARGVSPEGTGATAAKSIDKKTEAGKRPLTDQTRLDAIKMYVKGKFDENKHLGEAVAKGSLAVVASTGTSTAFDQYGDPTGQELRAAGWRIPPLPPAQCKYMFNRCSTELCASVLVAGSDRVEGEDELPIPATIAVEGRAGWCIGTVARTGERGQIPLSGLTRLSTDSTGKTWIAKQKIDTTKVGQASMVTGDHIVDVMLPVEIPQFVLQAGAAREDADASVVLMDALAHQRDGSFKTWKPPDNAMSSSLVHTMTQICLWAGMSRHALVPVVTKLVLSPQPEHLVDALGGQLKLRLQNVIDYMRDPNPNTERGYVSPFLQQDIAQLGAILTCGYGKECGGARGVLKTMYSTIIPADVQSMLDNPDKIGPAIAGVAVLKSPKGTGSTPKVLTAEAHGVMDKARELYRRIVNVVEMWGGGSQLWWFEGGGGAAAAAATGSSSASSAEGGGRRKRRTRRGRHARNKQVTRRSSRRLRRVVRTRRAYGRGRAQRTRSLNRGRRSRR